MLHKNKIDPHDWGFVPNVSRLDAPAAIRLPGLCEKQLFDLIVEPIKSLVLQKEINMKTKMKIKFEGQTHQIDANTLINTLIHYQSVITEANKGLSGGAKAIELKVNAFEKGSFVVDVSIEESFIMQMFSGDTMEYLANLATVVGGVFAAYKILKGKPAKSDKEKEAITININNNNIVVNQTIINVYNQPLVREAVSKSIETADADANVEGLIVDSDGQKPVVFKKENFKEYIYNDFDTENEIPNEISEEVEAQLTIIGLNFEPGSRWQFIYNGFKIQMIVKDDALMRKINEGERFGKGDSIKVKMKITKRYNPTYNAYENKSYRIIEFLDHILAPRQKDVF